MTAAEQRKKKAQQMADYYSARGDSTSAGAKAAQRAVSKAEGKTPYSASGAAVQKYRANKPTTVQDLYANRTTRQNNQTQAPNPALAQGIVNTVTAQSGGTSNRTVQGVQRRPTVSVADSILGTGAKRSVIAGQENNTRSTSSPTAINNAPSSAKKVSGYSGGADAKDSDGDSVMKSYQEGLKQAQAILQSYEKGEGVYDEKDYALAKEEADRYQELVDQRKAQQEEAASGVRQVRQMGADAKTGIKAIAKNPVMWASDTLGSAVDSAASGVASTAATLTDFGANVNEFTRTGNPEWQREQAAKMRNAANANAQSAAQYRQSAIETAGNTDFGAFATDLGVAGAQMGIDAATGGLLKTGTMAPMLVRSFGYGAQEAADAGFGANGQVLNGIKSAGVEYLSEKLFGGNPVYDADAGLVNKLLGNVLDENSQLIRVLSSKPADIVYEGLEEVVSDLLNPLIDQGALWVTGDDRIQVDWPKAEELLRDFAIGSALSAASNLATGQLGVSEPAQQQTVNQTQNAPVQQAAQEAAQQAPQPTGTEIAPAVENAESGVLNTAQQAQEATPTQTVADIYANRATKQPDGSVQVGRATTIKKPYTGTVPVQEQHAEVVVPVSDESLATAQSRIAEAKANKGEKAFKSALSAIYKKVFQPIKNVPVDSMTYEGQPYTVDVNKGVYRKVISDKTISAERLSVLDSLPEIIQNAQYVGSGEYGKAGRDDSPAIRYDYFETAVNIGGKDYAVLFDVEVLPSANNYRTHRIVEIEIAPIAGEVADNKNVTPQRPSDQLFRTGLSSEAYADTHVSNGTITRDGESVKPVTLDESIENFNRMSDEFVERLQQIQEESRTREIREDEVKWLEERGKWLNDEKQRIVGLQRQAQGVTSKNRGTAENHIDNRDWASVRKPSIKSFQFDHPELHKYYAQMAERLRDTIGIAMGGDRVVKTHNGRYINKAEVPDVIRGLVNSGATREQIMTACEHIINDEGQENYALAKRVEILLDDLLTNGSGFERLYDGEGFARVEPNSEYIAQKAAIEGGSTEAEIRARKDAEADEFVRMVEGDEWIDALEDKQPEAAHDGRDMDEGSLFDATKGPGAGATREGPQVPSQNNLTRDMNLSEEGRKAVAESTTTHEQISDKLANARADAQIIRGPDGSWVNLQDSVDDLRQTMAERGVLTPEQVKLAEKVMVELDRRAGESNNWEEVLAFNRDVIRPSKTGAAQSLRAWEEFSGGSVDVVSTAIDILESAKPNPNTNANKRRTATEADRILQRVSREVTNAENAIFGQYGLDDFFSTPTETAADIPKLRDIITKSWQNKQKVYDDILNYYVSKYGMSEQEAGLAANNIATQFYDELARLSDSALHRAFDKKAKREEKPWLDRAVELINLGALTSEDFQSVASQKLFGGTVDNAVLTQISEYAERAQDLRDANNTDGLRDLVVEIAAARGYKPGKGINKIIRERMTADQLYEVAQTSAAAIAVDKIKPTTAEKLSTWLYLSHLYNTRTIIRNVAANMEFSPLDRAANNIGIIPDFIFSMIRTAAEGGTVAQNRTVGYQPSMWAQTEGAKDAKAIRSGYVDQARVDNAMDINRNASEGKYSQKNEKITNRTYKRNGTGEGKLNKVWNRFNNFREGALGWGLNVTDAMQKGKTKGQSEVAMKRLKEHGSRISDAAAERITEDDMRYRSFQRDTPVGTGLAILREAANAVGLGEKNGRFFETTHEFGLGNMTGNYTQVPGALVHTVLDYTPAGVVNTTMELANAIKTAMGEQEAEVKRGKYKGMTNADASTVAQHNAAVSLARSLTGTGIMALFAALSKAGIVWYEPYGGDDKDKDETKAAQGLGGLQVNLSGLVRLASGQDTSARGDDIIYGFESSQPLGALATAGVLLADEDDDDVFMRTINATAKSVGEMITDLSMMNTAKTISDDIKYRGDKNAAEVLGDIAGDVAADSISGFIPGTIRQIAKVADDTMRDTSADTVQERVWNRFRNANPILRETLPAKVDYKGEERKYAGNYLTRGLNTFLLPGDVTIYQQDEVVDYIDRVTEETGKSLYAAAYAPKSFTVKDADGNEQTVTLNTDARLAYDEQYKGTYYAALYGLKNAGYADELSYEQVAEIGRELRSLAADSAKRLYCEQNGIEYSSSYDKYQDIEDPALYMAMKESLKQLRSSNGTDSEAFDAVYSQWKGLSPSEKKKYTEGIDGEFSGIDTLKKLDACIRGGMSTEQFFKAKNAHDDIDDLGLNAAEKRARFANWLDTQSRFTTAEKRTALANFPYTTTLVADKGNYEKMTAAGVSKDGGLALFNTMQKLEPAEGYTDVAGWQKNEAITSSGLTDEEQLAALSVYATDSAYDYYQTAYDYGIAPSKWSEVLANMRGYEGTLKSDGKSNSGALSQENLLRAMQDAGLSDQKQRAMYATYAAKKGWTTGYDKARGNINWRYYGY